MSTFVDIIETGFANNSQTLAVFLDIKAAFDNAWHPAILHQLIEKDCPAYLIHLLKSFLKDREVEIHCRNGTHSKTMSKGTPQGSVLSPFLWNLVIDNGIRCTFPKGVKMIAFADDIVLLTEGKHLAQMRSDMQVAYSTFSEWCSSMLLELTIAKTETVIFSRKHNTQQLPGQIFLTKDSVRYLG